MDAGDEFYMREALSEADAARAEGEVPIGAVVVREGAIIGRGHNAVIRSSDPSAHAEVMALRSAAVAGGNYRLSGSILYSTVEPCAMCAGAIVHARVARLVYGAADLKAGVIESHLHFLEADFLNHRVEAEGGVLEHLCREMLQSFFRDKRKAGSDAERCESG
ncbi:MAG TPA: tRNA adenosine(34) deaminase TadA [Blastocatellia bacterium]|nr:tRNA adenosine(34) deaminase TadA [Blastocatellia bacterium]